MSCLAASELKGFFKVESPLRTMGAVMLNWIKDLAANAIALTRHNPRLLLVVAAVLMIDIALLGLFLQWAYVEHYGVTDSVFFANSLFSTQDHSLIEDFGYLKELVTCLVLGALFLRTRVFLYLAFSVFFLVLLADDSLRFHEHFGALVGQAFGPSYALLGEDIGAAIAGLVPIAMIAVGWLKAPAEDRRNGELIGLGIGLLLFFGLAIDYLHAAGSSPMAGGETLAALLEDGGELISLSLILFAALAVGKVFRPTNALAATGWGPSGRDPASPSPGRN